MKAVIDNEGILRILPQTREELEDLEHWIKNNIVLENGRYRYAHRNGLEFCLRLPVEQQEVKV